MIGYHATAFRNVEGIMRDGLIPYKIRGSWVPSGWRGIWLWEDRPIGMDWLHIALHRWIDHQSPQVALLAVEYSDRDIIAPNGNSYQVSHDGSFQGTSDYPRWFDHQGRLAWIIWRRIAAGQVTLIDDIDFTTAGHVVMDGRGLGWPTIGVRMGQS